MKFGKLAPRQDDRTLKFASYTTPALPPAPPALNNFTDVAAKLGADEGTLFPMDANDTIGDCTIAGAAHADTVFAGRTGKSSILSAAQCQAVYFQLTGGQDTGLVMLDVMKFWRSTGIGGEKPLSFVVLDLKSQEDIFSAVDLFGGVYLGFQVQEDCIADFQAGRPWYPGQPTGEGHCVFLGGYDQSDEPLILATWGRCDQRATMNWWEQMVDEAYAILPQEASDSSFAPGFDLAQLQADLALVTG